MADDVARRSTLQAGAAALDVSLSDAQLGLLLRYLDLLGQWNRVYNLTAIRDPAQMLTHHLLDSLSIVPVIRKLAPSTVLDVGSGAGLPGVPLAVALPTTQVTLIDAVQKKTAFLNQVKGELHLPVRVIHGRVEAPTLKETFSCVVSRAFASLAEFVELCGARVAPGGHLVAMKGAPSPAEVAALPGDWRVKESFRLEVAGLCESRSAYVLQRQALRP